MPRTGRVFILLELGGAFTAAIAVEGGRIVDGIGGSSGPLGLRAAGALDGEVAFLAGCPKRMIFDGGAAGGRHSGCERRGAGGADDGSWPIARTESG